MKGVLQKADLLKKIKRLKREKNAVILAHSYQRPEIHEVADFIGDSLGLCIEASNTNADIIVFCGVNFMAESAAILNPGKKVLIPHRDAGCAMADMIDPEGLKNLKKKHPDAKVVTYVNSSAEIKALSDVCCTSSNAVEVVKAMPGNKIIFVPDKNLAAYVASKVPEKEIIPWDGFCPAHHFVTKEMLDDVRRNSADAKIIAHPESRKDVLEESDYVASTSSMINCAKKDPAKEFFVLTECGMTERLRSELPSKKFTGLCNLCFDMKKNTLESVCVALEKEKEVVEVEKQVSEKAMKAFEKMFSLTR